jgi:hypothetical protein
MGPMGPETHNHSILGQLIKDGEYPWWLSQIEVLGRRVEFSLKTDLQLSSELIDKAVVFVNGLTTEESVYKSQIANDVMEYYGNTAVLSGLNLEEVQQKMQLEYIGFSDGNNFQLSYDDGGIFGGHLMTGYFDQLGQLTSSEIAG